MAPQFRTNHHGLKNGYSAYFQWPPEWEGNYTSKWQSNGSGNELGSGMNCPGINTSFNQSTGWSGKESQDPFFLRLRERIHWWRQNTMNPQVLNLIEQGVQNDWDLPSQLSKVPCIRKQEETHMAWETIQEYLEVGALKEIAASKARHLIPWFVIKKGDKLRLITDCREVNHYLSPKPFKLENWAEIFPYLRKGMWAAKIDLKHAYFHLALSEELKPYTCIQVEDKVFQFQAACFGLSTLPQAWQSVMKVFLKKWRSQGILTWVYLDDILLVGQSPQAVRKNLKIMLKDLEDSGMVLNLKKSVLEPSQQVEHLGFSIDFQQGVLQVQRKK
jgi:hypothetical protein